METLDPDTLKPTSDGKGIACLTSLFRHGLPLFSTATTKFQSCSTGYKLTTSTARSLKKAISIKLLRRFMPHFTSRYIFSLYFMGNWGRKVIKNGFVRRN